MGEEGRQAGSPWISHLKSEASSPLSEISFGEVFLG